MLGEDEEILHQFNMRRIYAAHSASSCTFNGSSAQLLVACVEPGAVIEHIELTIEPTIVLFIVPQVYDVISVHAPEMVPVLVVATAQQTVVRQRAAAVVNGRQVIADGTQVCVLDVGLADALTRPSIVT